jgi:hypothetical protein
MIINDIVLIESLELPDLNPENGTRLSSRYPRFQSRIDGIAGNDDTSQFRKGDGMNSVCKIIALY